MGALAHHEVCTTAPWHMLPETNLDVSSREMNQLDVVNTIYQKLYAKHLDEVWFRLMTELLFYMKLSAHAKFCF